MAESSNRPVDPDAPPHRRAHRAQPLAALEVTGAYLTLETVMQLTSLGKTTIYKMMRAGDFPERVHVTKRAVRWRAEDIRGWLRL
jgi:prophage regulatory protein